jgi:hypothetical protein
MLKPAGLRDLHIMHGTNNVFDPFKVHYKKLLLHVRTVASLRTLPVADAMLRIHAAVRLY